MTGSEAEAAAPGVGVAPVLDRIVGQARARALLGALASSPVHALLFVGPAGSGKKEVATAYAAALLCPEGGCGVCATCHDVLRGLHPDVTYIERQGPFITVGDAGRITQLAQRSPLLAQRQVLILSDFHLVDRAGPALLKTIEEPPDTTYFVILADQRVQPLATIASRCVDVEFSALDADTISEALVSAGAEVDAASAAAAASRGRLDRACLLVSDPGFAEREARWRSVPERLDGTGTTVVALARELVGGSEELLTVLRERQEGELAALDSAAKEAGLRRVPDRRAVEERHRRAQRQMRVDELRAGLATLASVYRARLDAEHPSSRRVGAPLTACGEIDVATSRLLRNVNETLLIEWLLLRLEAASRARSVIELRDLAR